MQCCKILSKRHYIELRIGKYPCNCVMKQINIMILTCVFPMVCSYPFFIAIFNASLLNCFYCFALLHNWFNSLYSCLKDIHSLLKVNILAQIGPVLLEMNLKKNNLFLWVTKIHLIQFPLLINISSFPKNHYHLIILNWF